MTSKAEDLLMGAPGMVTNEQLRELHINNKEGIANFQEERYERN